MLHAQSCPTLCDPIDCSLPGSSLSMGFSRQDYWSGLPFPSPGDLTDPGTESMSSALAGGFFTVDPPWEAPLIIREMKIKTTMIPLHTNEHGYNKNMENNKCW